jgi:HSP20 family molecular chaperone IbpA
MAKQSIALKKADSVLDELERLHHEISRRAYDLFRTHETLFTGPLDDWLRAERELVWRPAVELRQKDGEFELLAAIAGVEPKELDVQVTPEDILITSGHEHRHETKEGTVHLCEFEGGRLFRSVHLPDRIDPESVKAEYRNGLLRITAAVAKASSPGKVDIQAA